MPECASAVRVLPPRKDCDASDGGGWAASTFGIGHGKYNGANVDYLSGSLSRLGLAGRALTASEVAALYAVGLH